MKVETRDEQLRRMLREADPADAESGLTTEEVRAMRRAVLTAAPEPRRRFFALSPLLAGAAMAVLAAIAVLLLWPRAEPAPPPPSAPPRIAVKEPVSDLQRTAVEPTDVRPEVRTETHRRTRAAAAGPRIRRPVAPTPGVQIAAANEPETETRQIQFETSGGTRVIWILSANNGL